MSKNLAEPSTQRFIAGHGYNIRNLTRRPADYDSISGPWPTQYHIGLFATWCLTRYASGWDRVDENPNASYPPHRAVWNNYRLRLGASNTTRTAADGDYWTWGARIGPQNAIWYLAGHFLQGPDFGNINIDFYGPLTEEHDGTLTPDVDTIETNGDWIWANTQPASFLIGYNASERSTQACDPILIPTGQPGTIATAYGGSAGSGGLGPYETDGGPGIYAFKMRVDGKTVASSGYKAAIAELILVRGADFQFDLYIG